MTLHLRADGVLEVDGAEAGLVTGLRVGAGDASLDHQKLQGQSGAELTFDGWSGRRLDVDLVLPGTDDAQQVAALQSAATARDAAGALHVWSLAGDLPRALALAAVVWAGQPELDRSTADDAMRVSLSWIEIDPEVDRIVVPPDPPPVAEEPADLGDAAAAEAAARLDAAAEGSGL